MKVRGWQYNTALAFKYITSFCRSVDLGSFHIPQSTFDTYAFHCKTLLNL